MGKFSRKFHMKRKPMSNSIKFSMLGHHPPPSFFLSQRLAGRGWGSKLFLFILLLEVEQSRVQTTACSDALKDLSVASYSWN